MTPGYRRRGERDGRLHWRSDPSQLRPAESDARLAELLRDVNAPPTPAELCSPLALDAWRYNRSAHVAALRAAPGARRRRRPVRRHTPVAPVVAAAAAVAVVALTMGGAIWRGGTVVVPYFSGVAGQPSSGVAAPVSSSPATPRRGTTKTLVPAPDRGSSAAATRSPSSSGSGLAPASNAATVTAPDGAGRPVAGDGAPVTIAAAPERSGPTGAPASDPGAGQGAAPGSTNAPAGPGDSSSTTSRSTNGHTSHDGHGRRGSPPTSASTDGGAATSVPPGEGSSPSESVAPCLGPQGQQLPPRACEGLADEAAASSGPTPSS